VLFFICLFILFSYPSVSLFWLSIMPPTNV
jgi:hypothetical protein